MTDSNRYLQKLTLCCICFIAYSAPSLAQTAEHACGNQAEERSGIDFGTFRALANPAINAPATDDSRVVQASHNTTAKSPASAKPARKSPSASRIPSTIVMDPDVATIRLVTASDDATGDSPALLPVPSEVPIIEKPLPADLLSKLTRQAAQSGNTVKQPVPNNRRSRPICDPGNAPKSTPNAEPFATLTEADSRGVPKNWHVSTRRPKVIDEIGHDGLVIATEREFAPTPKPINTSDGKAHIALTSATEDVASEPRNGEVPFWVQPSLLGKLESDPFEAKPPATETKVSTLAEFEVEQPATVVESSDSTPEPEELEEPKKVNWASMPAPGRPEDNPAPKPKVKPERKRWAGLFVEEIEDDGSAKKTYMTQVAFDQPITGSTVPGDNLFAQAAPRRPLTTGRRRMRLNFLDDPGERASDPTRDAIKSMLEGDEDEPDDGPSSLLDDLEEDTSKYRERYRYAFEDVIEPLPVKKAPRNYAATLKDIFADDDETNPAAEQAFCGLMWSCAGGKCMTPIDRMKRNYRRNYALFYSPCNTQVCRPMEGFEERVRAMTPPPQPVPATIPQLSTPPQAIPVPQLPQSNGPIQPLPNASA